MFTAKQQPTTTSGPATTGNQFLNAGMKQSARTTSGNGAMKYSTTGNEFVDQFGQLGSMKAPRNFKDIAESMSILYAKNPFLAVCFALYIRLISRVVSLFDGTKTTAVQRGAGLKHEGIMRFVWLGIFHPQVFQKNLHLLVAAGSWKDIFYILQMDLVYNSWKGRTQDWDFIGKFILAGLENPKTSELVKKYLPQIKSNSKCKTIEAQADNQIAKWICSLLYGNKEDGKTYKKYRQLKTSGTAHQWQQLISQGKFLEIDFNTVAGRALAQLVSGKFLEKNNLEKEYERWISSKPIAKFTGYPHELFKKIGTKKYQIKTLNKQFDGLVETAKKGAKKGTSLIVVRDTSGSMGSEASGTGMSCGDVGKALALFFSQMLPEGYFSQSWIEFNSDAKMHTWKGATAYEKWSNDHSRYVGSTEFQSVINLFIKIRLSGVSEDQFPTGILCISDGELNPGDLRQTNVNTALTKLRTCFSEDYVNNFQIVLWNLQSDYYGSGTGKKFETYGGVKNVYYFSGYDGSVVAFLTGTEHQEKQPETAEELFSAAMDQELLKLVQV